MRVLVVWHAAVVPAYRERFRALCRANPEIDLHVIAPQKSYEGGQWIAGTTDPRDPFQLHILPAGWITHPNGLFYKTSLRFLRHLNPEVVHIHEEAWTLGALQFVLAFYPRVPIILETWENLVRSPKRPFRWLEPFVMRRISRFIAGTPDIFHVLTAKGVRAPIDVIPYGTAFTERRVPRTMSVVPRIGYIGRLTPEKGVSLLLDALPQVSRDMEVYVVGNGPLESLVHDTRAAYSHLKLYHTPAVSPHDVPGLLRTFDVLVLPSQTTRTWAEQFGRVLIEAMAVGTVPIGSTSGSIPWVIGDAGWVFPEGNVRVLAQKIDHLLGNTGDWQQLSLKGQQRVRMHFTWDRVAHKLANTYYHAARKGTCYGASHGGVIR